MNKKSCLFIRPPFEGMGKYKPPHLGIASLYGYVKNRFPEIEFNFLDALVKHQTIEDIIFYIDKYRPDIICFTVKTMQIDQTKEIIELTKRIYSPIIICGGNHISVCPEDAINAGANYAIIGEGELAFSKILNCIIHPESEFSLNAIQDCNIITKNNLNLIKPKPKIELKGEQIPFPEWSIMNIPDYNENIHYNKSEKALPVMASRGCPFQCDFCSTHLTWTPNVRYRNPTDVLMEIKQNILKYGIDHIHFYDDNLMLNRKWLCDFLSLIENEKIDFKWICLSRPDIIIKNRDLLSRMKKNGCKGFELGFETEDDELYSKMNKKNTKNTFKLAYDILIKEKFEMIEFLIMCFYEGETLCSLYKTYKQLNNYKKQSALFIKSRYFATPFPGTQYYEKVMRKGIDISKGNKHKYAIFLNYIPYSFIDSKMTGFDINKNTLNIQLNFREINDIIYKEEFDNITKTISNDYFCILFNRLSEQGKTINQLCQKILEKVDNKVPIFAIYEYVGRLLEFSAEVGALHYNEDIFC